MIFKAALLVAILGTPSSTYLRRKSLPYTFPDDFETCSADTSINPCLVDLIQDALNKLGARGISAPISFSLNPMTLDFWAFHVDIDAVKIDEYFWNLSHPTLWNSTVLSASFDPSSLSLTYSTFHDHITQYSRYKSWGQLYYDADSGPEAVYGNGSATKHLYNVTLEHAVVFFPATVGKTEYLFVSSYDLLVDGFSDATFDYQNLYDGDEILAKRALNLINENAVNIVIQQIDVLTDLLVTMFKLYTQRLISSAPASQVLAHLAGI